MCEIKSTNTYVRKGIYSIEDVLSEYSPRAKGGAIKKVEFDGDMIKMSSQRYQVFKNKGLKCVTCGIEGVFFAKEIGFHDTHNVYHFNLYALKDGEEVLMTKDHIIPRSKGGRDHIDNYQTMCYLCNHEKGDSFE